MNKKKVTLVIFSSLFFFTVIYIFIVDSSIEGMWHSQPDQSFYLKEGKIFKIDNQGEKNLIGSYGQFEDKVYKTMIDIDGVSYSGRIEKKFLKLLVFQDGKSMPLVLRKFNVSY